LLISTRTDASIVSGEVGTSIFHRRYGSFSLNQEVRIRPYDPIADLANAYLGVIHIQVSYLKKGYEATETFDAAEMAQVFLNSFNNQVFSREQTVVFDFHGVNLVGSITGMESINVAEMKGSLTGKGEASMAPTERGILMNQTQVNFSKAADSNIKLKGSGAKSAAANAIIQPTFKFEDLGIGGLDKEFSAIFRRAFASRIFPPALVEKLGIQHVKGILLYGPPGTGKTLMARQIGKMLNAKEPLIVNGPEILNKYVGQSEENIRKLFAPAEADYKAMGEESPLHIIIFDELDAICKQRGGNKDGGTGVGDSVVNQLLAKMDGVEQLNNILIIGMTNRLDMIDEALLRPGRLEIHMEISLPDEKGRVEILKIHTSKMRDNSLLGPDVDLNELAFMTKNFSGAEIAGLCKSASSWAFNRHVKVGSMATVSDDIENMKITRDDFMRALEEVKPAFGVSEEELSACVQNGVIPYSPIVDVRTIYLDSKLIFSIFSKTDSCTFLRYGRLLELPWCLCCCTVLLLLARRPWRQPLPWRPNFHLSSSFHPNPWLVILN
jgi:vesicle-fusing ATPase